MKKIMFFTVLIGIAFILYAQDVESIVRDSRNRIKAETVSTRSRMVIQAKDGSTSERVFDQYSKDGPNGKRIIIAFMRPETWRETRYMDIENSGGSNNRYLFIPFRNDELDPSHLQADRTRRISSTLGIEEFAKTDFSYDDLVFENRNVSLDTHSLLREEDLNGNICYVIQSVPKDNSYQYSKMILWIAKDTLITMKIEMYNKRNILVKIAEMSSLKEVQGRLIATVIKMTTLPTNTSTIIFKDTIRFNDPVPDGVFTPKYLETGRL